KDEASGEVTELRCTYDPATKSGSAEAGGKVKGTLHWGSAAHAAKAEGRLYDRPFVSERPGGGGRAYGDGVDPGALEVLAEARVEPSLAAAESGARYQFERQGYFCVDVDSSPGRLVFNRTVTLRDSWAKIEQAEGRGRPA